MRNAFTLVEVIVALVVLQVALVGVAGTLQLASRTVARAEVLESAVARSEGILDSLAGVRLVVGGTSDVRGASVIWTVGVDGTVLLRAETRDGALLFGFPAGMARP